MTEADWESLEEDIIELIDNVGIAGIVDEAEELTARYIAALRRYYREANEDDDADD